MSANCIQVHKLTVNYKESRSDHTTDSVVGLTNILAIVSSRDVVDFQTSIFEYHSAFCKRETRDTRRLNQLSSIAVYESLMRCKSLTRQVSCQVLRDLRHREENINSVKALNLEIIIIVACCCHNSHSWDVKETHIACRPPINLHWSSFCGREQNTTRHWLHFLSLSCTYYFPNCMFPLVLLVCIVNCSSLSLSPSLPPVLIYIQSTQCSKARNANWQCWGEWMKASLDGFSLSFFIVEFFLCFFSCSIARFQFEFYAAHVQR